jgi:hypothetical protein
MYPNPTSEILNIKLIDDTMTLQNIFIYNNLGQLISSTKEMTIDTSNFSEGVYFVQIITDKGNSSKKLIID